MEVANGGRTHSGPHLIYAASAKKLKGEDVMDAKLTRDVDGNPIAMYLLCDGHQGVGAAKFVVDVFHKILVETLPVHMPNFNNAAEVLSYAAKVRGLLSDICVNIDNEWSKLKKFSGSTLTVVVITGWLLTSANLGDSTALIDIGSSFLDLTQSHRLQCNKLEVKRLETEGAVVAPLGTHLQGPAKPNEMGVGPLRLWPGGLCVSRSIGDLDAGPLVVPIPHVKQLMLPRDGSRLLVASDGLWDILSPKAALKLVRHKSPQEAVDTLVSTAARDRRFCDDITIIVADNLPDASTAFPVVALKNVSLDEPVGRTRSSRLQRSVSKSGGGLFSCFKGSADMVDEPPPPPPEPAGPRPPPPKIELLVDIDMFLQEGVAKASLLRNSVPPGRTSLDQRPGSYTYDPSLDYTMHGPAHPKLFTQDPNSYLDPSRHGGSHHGPLNDCTAHGSTGYSEALSELTQRSLSDQSSLRNDQGTPQLADVRSLPLQMRQ